jgi:RNA polymerase sigma-70 factor (ECF subfamily)
VKRHPNAVRSAERQGTWRAFCLDPGEVTFRPVYREIAPLVYTLCRRILRDEDDARDAFQAAHLRLIALARSEGETLAAMDMARTVSRLAVREADALRRRRRRRRLREVLVDIMPNAPSSTPSPQQIAADNQLRARVEALIETLPERQRIPVLLHFHHGMTHREIAEALGKPVSTISNRIAKGLRTLQPRMRRAGIGDATIVLAAILATASLLSPPQALGAPALFAGAGATAAGVSLTSLASPVAETALGGTLMKSAAVVTTIAVLTGLTAVFTARSDETTDTTPSVAAAPTPGDNLLTNGSFEDNNGIVVEGQGGGPQPTGWNRGAPVDGVEYIYAQDDGHSGSTSVAFRKTENRHFPIAQWSQTFDHGGSSSALEVSAWIKAQDVTKAVVDVQFTDAQGDWTHEWAVFVGQRDQSDPVVTHDWREHTGTVDIPPGTQAITVGLQMYGPGAVAFDDVVARYGAAVVHAQAEPGLSFDRIVRTEQIVKDCMILAYLPDWNHGNVDNLAVANNGGGVRTLIGIPEIPPEDALREDREFYVQLHVREVTAGVDPSPIAMHEIMQDWPEMTSWNTRPPIGEAAAHVAFNPTEGFHYFDITPIVRAAAREGRPLRGVMLRFEDESREGDWSGYAFDGSENDRPANLGNRKPSLFVVSTE